MASQTFFFQPIFLKKLSFFVDIWQRRLAILFLMTL